jgi:hypothetical protein
MCVAGSTRSPMHAYMRLQGPSRLRLAEERGHAVSHGAEGAASDCQARGLADRKPIAPAVVYDELLEVA